METFRGSVYQFLLTVKMTGNESQENYHFWWILSNIFLYYIEKRFIESSFFQWNHTPYYFIYIFDKNNKYDSLINLSQLDGYQTSAKNREIEKKIKLQERLETIISKRVLDWSHDNHTE